MSIIEEGTNPGRRRLMSARVAVAFALILGLSSLAGAQATTRPSSSAAPDPRLELRANQAFNRGEYVTALPLLKTLADTVNEPSRLGAIQEKIRVCQKAIEAAKAAPPAAA